MRSLYSQTLTRIALTSAARINGTANGTTVDLGVFGNNCRTLMFCVTTATVTDGSHALTLEHSDNGSAWSAVDAGNVQGTLPTITGTNDDAVFEFGLKPEKRYARIVATTSGATTGGIFSAVALMSHGGNNPVARA